jgi:hypothetical protein
MVEEVMTTTNYIQFAIRYDSVRVPMLRERHIACTFITMMWRAAVIVRVRRSIAHIRDGTQRSDFFQKTNPSLVTALKTQQESIRLED